MMRRLTLLVLLLVITIPFSAYGIDGQIKISQPVLPDTFPVVINKPGSYVLTSNLIVEDPNLNAIEITVNDVTLDLNGHTIKGPNLVSGGTGQGIEAENRYNITIKNGRVWGFSNYGIYLHSLPGDQSEKGAGHVVEGLQVANNNSGGMIVHGGLVSNCLFINNFGTAGIWAFNSIVTDCTANNNNVSGIRATNSIVANCTTHYNHYGIDTAGISGGGGSRIEGNNMRNNAYGLVLTWNTPDYAIMNSVSDSSVQNFYDAGLPGFNYMPIWPAGGDNANYEFIPSDLGDWCEINSHPISLSFMYTGGGCAASNNSQDSLQWDCSGSIDSLQPISVTSSNTGYHINPITVSPGEGFVVTNSGNPLTSSSNFTLTNQGGTEQLEIHTSCSQPLVQGDVFGSLTLINYTGQ